MKSPSVKSPSVKSYSDKKKPSKVPIKKLKVEIKKPKVPINKTSKTKSQFPLIDYYLKQTSVSRLAHKTIQQVKGTNARGVHPGGKANLMVFWPLYLQHITKNLKVVHETVKIFKGSSRVTIDDYTTPISRTLINPKYSRKKYRFHFYTLHIVSPGGKYAHANALIYDNETQILERFEPHGLCATGFVKLTSMDINHIQKAIQDRFKLHIVKFNQPSYTCPLYGPQSVCSPNIIDRWFDNLMNIGGYCAAWTMFYTLMRVTHPEIHPMILQNDMIKYTKRVDATGGARLIRSFYGDFIRFKISVVKY